MADISKAEQSLCTRLGAVLVSLPPNSDVPESDAFQEVLQMLECFLPEVLRMHYPLEWRDESLDGIFPAIARIRNGGELEIIGMCIFLNDPIETPIHVQLRMDSSGDTISQLDCKLGERVDGKIPRRPYSHEGAWAKYRHALLDRVSSIDWAYTARLRV